MSSGWITLIIVLVIVAAMVAALYFLGKRAEKRQAEQQAQLDLYKQQVTMLIIDKKKMRMKDSGINPAVLAQTPKRYQLLKVPVVKAKIGPQIMSLIADDKIFDEIPVKKEVKATVSGIYLTSVKGLHGKTNVEKAPKSKFKAWMEKMQEKAGAGQVK